MLFTTREAAAALGVTVRTIARWVHSGRIKPAKDVAGYHIFTGDEIARVARQAADSRANRQLAQLPFGA